jgi:zinc protease
MSNETLSLPGPDDITRQVLSNGITVLTRSNFNSPSVVVTGYFGAGSLMDPDDKLGLAEYTSYALMRGTKNRTFDQIYNELEAVGASLGFSSGVHTSGFNGRSLAEDLPRRAQDTSDMASMVFEEILFKGHPYSRPEDGHPETIQRIKRGDLVKFHQDYYGPRGMVVAIVGAVTAEEAIKQVKRALGSWQVKDQKETLPLPELKLLKKTVSKHHRIPGKSQSDLVIGTNGPRRRDPEYMSASLGNNILGQFGMMGRIGDVVREKSGLAYYAYSSISAGIGPGSWEVSAGVNPQNVKLAVDLIKEELKRFVQEGITEEELADSKANFIGRLPLSLESNGGVANALINMERHQLGMDYYRRYPSIVNEVSREDILKTARKFIDVDRLAIAVAGP